MKRLRLGICIVMLALMVMPVNSAYAGEYDDDFATVSTWLNDINGKLALVYAESTNILMQLNQRTISNTYTLRYYIEETYNDQHKIWLQLTTDTQNSSTTIRGYLSNISTKASNIKTSIDSVQTDIASILTKQTSIASIAGDIYARLGAMKTSDENFYTMMENWDLSWVSYKNQLLDWGTSWNTTFGTISTNIAAINSNLITGFTSIEDSLDDLYSKTNDIYVILNQVKGVINNSNYIRVGQTPNGAFYDAVIDIRDKLRLVNTNISSMKTTLEAITIPNYSTVLNSISGYVDGIEGKLDTLHTDLQSLVTLLTPVVGTQTNNSKYIRVGQVGEGALYVAITDIRTAVNSISGFVDGIETKLDTLHTDLQNIFHFWEPIRGYNTDRDLYYWRVGQVDFGNFYNSVNGVKGKMDTFQTTLASLLYETEDINEGIGDVIDAINAIPSSTITVNTSAITTRLDTIIGLLSVPNNTSSIVGDLNSVDFSDDVDDLVDTISELAPFGAVLLMSEEVQILASVAPVQNPTMTVPFQFFGQNVVTIDFTWLDDLRPAINFFLMFLLILSLGQISLKFVQVEAGS